MLLESPGGHQTRFVEGGGSYGSASDPQLHFGLGADTKIEKVTAYWPSGQSQEVAGPEPGAYRELTEGEAQPKRVGVK